MQLQAPIFDGPDYGVDGFVDTNGDDSDHWDTWFDQSSSYAFAGPPVYTPRTAGFSNPSFANASSSADVVNQNTLIEAASLDATNGDWLDGYFEYENWYANYASDYASHVHMSSSFTIAWHRMIEWPRVEIDFVLV